MTVRIDPQKKLVLNEINQIAKIYGLNIFAVGGFVRDMVLNRNSNDIDLASPDYSALKLAGLLSASAGVQLKFHHRMGAAHFTFKGTDFDFQAYKPNYEVLSEIRKVDAPQNHLTLNVFSRDFTINSLVLSINTYKVYDVTKKGLSDIKDKIIRTPIDPMVSIKTNPIIILRAIMFQNRLGFEVDEGLKKAMIQGKDRIMSSISEKRFQYAIDGILKPDRNRGEELLREYGIDTISPKPIEEYLK